MSHAICKVQPQRTHSQDAQALEEEELQSPAQKGSRCKEEGTRRADERTYRVLRGKGQDWKIDSGAGSCLDLSGQIGAVSQSIKRKDGYGSKLMLLSISGFGKEEELQALIIKSYEDETSQ